jgi:2'-5' RNA ligase
MKRVQLTLFVDENESTIIEYIRNKFNPIQYNLIKSHVTLCREDELEEIEKIIVRLTALHYNYVKIYFGAPIRFANGKGVLLPAINNNEDFELLRKIILLDKARNHEPHITLMHPRNAICTNVIFEQIEKEKLPTTLIFKKVSLIEQEEGKKWNIVKEFYLKETM